MIGRLVSSWDGRTMLVSGSEPTRWNSSLDEKKKFDNSWISKLPRLNHVAYADHAADIFVHMSFFHKCQISQDLFQKTNPQHLLYQQPFKSWPPLNPINDLCSWLNWPPIWGIHPFQLGRKPTHGFLRFVNSLPPAWKISNPNAMHSSMPRHNYPQVKHGCFTVQP